MSLPTSTQSDVPRVSVAIWSDVVCPWCFIGERRLRRALAGPPPPDIDLHWRPFQLEPKMPPSGMPWADFVQAKYGGTAQADAAFAEILRAGMAEQIAFRFDRIVTVPNTVDAHRLLLLAESQGYLAQTAESLYTGYFCEGANLSDDDTLIHLASRAGIAPADAQEALYKERFQAEISESQLEAEELGMHEVPFYTFRALDGHQWGINGIAETSVFAQALDAAVRHGER